MKDQLARALEDFYRSRKRPQLELGQDGLWRPQIDDLCDLCKNSAWSSGSGAHLKQPEHYALKYGLDVKMFMRATKPLAFGPSNLAWKAVDYSEDSYLTSSYNFKWLPQEVNYAECSDNHEIPDENCSCGLYFFWSPFEALEYWSGNVILKCEIGGKVIEATKGCRAEAAVIRGIYSNDEKIANKVSEMYQVPIVGLMEDYDVIAEL